MALDKAKKAKGFILDWRCALDWPWFRFPATAHLFRWCCLRANHKPARVAVAGRIVDLNPGQFVSGMKQAAKETGLSRKQVRTARKHLEREKSIFWAQEGADPFSVITVCNWTDYQPSASKRGTVEGRVGAQPGHSRGTVGAPDNNVNNVNNVNKGGQTPPIPPQLDTPAFREAWSLWTHHRKEIRHGLTPTTVKRQFARLIKWGPDRAVAAIDHSIANGWEGIFEPDRQGASTDSHKREKPGGGFGRATGGPEGGFGGGADVEAG